MAADLLGLLLRANLAAAAAILVILALRLPVARRLGAQAAYALWAAVPLSALAVLLPARVATEVVIQSIPAAPSVAATSAYLAQAVVQGVAPALDLVTFALLAWALGALAWLLALAHSQYAFRRMLGRLRPEGSVFRSEAPGVGPVLLGALRPRIILPADFEARFTAEERAVVLAHEQIHLRNGDHLVNVLAALAQCLGWFNPLVHLAVFHLRIDQELACDAAVVARHPEQRRTYAEAMLKAQLLPASAPLACHWPARRPHPLMRRLALLRDDLPSRARRSLGLALAATLSLAGGVAAWAAQPAQVEVVVQPAPGSEAGWRAERRIEAQRAAAARAKAASTPKGRQLGHALMQAVLVDDDATAAQLLADGADPNAQLIGDGSPLIVAAREGRLDLARRLLAAGADVNGFVMFDETPLINAARAGQLEMVKYLLDHGADPNLTVPSGNHLGEMRSPLGMAGDPEVARYLRSRGARS